MIPDWLILHPKKPANGTDTYALMWLKYADRHTHRCTALKQKPFAAALGVSLRTLRTTLRGLEAIGAITTIPNFNKGDRMASTYQMHFDAPAAVQGCGRNLPHPPAETCRAVRIPDVRTQIPPNPPRGESPAAPREGRRRPAVTFPDVVHASRAALPALAYACLRNRHRWELEHQTLTVHAVDAEHETVFLRPWLAVLGATLADLAPGYTLRVQSPYRAAEAAA